MALNFKSKELYEAMRNYVRAAMSLLVDECPNGLPRILKGLEEWRRDADNLFRRQAEISAKSTKTRLTNNEQFRHPSCDQAQLLTQEKGERLQC